MFPVWIGESFRVVDDLTRATCTLFQELLRYGLVYAYLGLIRLLSLEAFAFSVLTEDIDTTPIGCSFLHTAIIQILISLKQADRVLELWLLLEHRVVLLELVHVLIVVLVVLDPALDQVQVVQHVVAHRIKVCVV